MSYPKVTPKRFKTVLIKFQQDSGLSGAAASTFLGFGRNFINNTLNRDKKELKPATVAKINESLEFFYAGCEAAALEPIQKRTPVKKPSFIAVFKAFLFSIFSTIKGNK